MITLTPRLRCIAELVPACRCAADIGTDHAYVPLYLLAQKKIRRAVASDIHEGPRGGLRKIAGKKARKVLCLCAWERGCLPCGREKQKAL